MSAGVDEVRFTHVGGPTTLLEVGGWTILVDPTFDPPGRRYSFGWGTASTKEVGPAIAVEDLPPIDVVLVSHDHHADNLDDAGRALLPGAHWLLTTVPGAKRLRDDGCAHAEGLAAWDTKVLEAEGKVTIRVTATPCRHGPVASYPIVGQVVGFALEWEGQQHGCVWISGDTVDFAPLHEVPKRLDVGTAILHLGGVQFGLTGPIHYTWTAADGLAFAEELDAHTIVPVHFEGWSHFRDGPDELEAAVAAAPAKVRDAVLHPEIGTPVQLEV
jgi:L-ascorbate metabolism protein UlaG (beta-lactamase superfamily)